MNTDYPTIISFYTDTWEYKSHADRLRKECDALGLPYFIKKVPDTGSWLDNTRIKPFFIYETITELKRPIFWLDVDASIMRMPVELKLPVDVDFMSVHQRTGPRRTWHVGTMFFNYNQNVVNFLHEWTLESKSGTDELNYETVWKRHAENFGITSKELPLTYYSIPEAKYNMEASSIIIHRLSKCPSKPKRKKVG